MSKLAKHIEAEAARRRALHEATHSTFTRRVASRLKMLLCAIASRQPRRG